MYANPYFTLGGVGATAESSGGFLDTLSSSLSKIGDIVAGGLQTGVKVYTTVERVKAAEAAKKAEAEREAALRAAEAKAVEQARFMAELQQRQQMLRQQQGFMGMDTTTLMLVGGGVLALVAIPMLMKK